MAVAVVLGGTAVPAIPLAVAATMPVLVGLVLAAVVSATDLPPVLAGPSFLLTAPAVSAAFALAELVALPGLRVGAFLGFLPGSEPV